MNDNFEILDEYDFLVAGKLNKLNLDRSGSDEAKAKNIKILTENNWNQIGNFLFYITCEKQSLKKVNIWINPNTGMEPEEKVIQQEVIKHFLDQGYSQYKSGYLLYKWESQENHNPARVWINSNTGLPPLLAPMDAGEGDYNGDIDDSDESNHLLSEVKLRKRYNPLVEDLEIDTNTEGDNLCDKICNYIASLFI